MEYKRFQVFQLGKKLGNILKDLNKRIIMQNYSPGFLLFYNLVHQDLPRGVEKEKSNLASRKV